jgi:hypothetical protein
LAEIQLRFTVGLGVMASVRTPVTVRVTVTVGLVKPPVPVKLKVRVFVPVLAALAQDA